MWGKSNKIEFNFNQRVENSGILEAQKKINERWFQSESWYLIKELKIIQA